MVALAVSASVVPQLRLLHFFQALIYVAVIFLARRDQAWGFGAGVTIAVAWNSLNLFVTHLMFAGAVAFWSFLRTGHTHRVDTIMVLLGGLAHFVLIVACMAAFFHSGPGKKDWGKFLGGGVLVLAYFGMIVATMAPH
jgi:hypothetical protein